jgi:hypothetical protein
VSGWIVVVSALCLLLLPIVRDAFIIAGIIVEFLGLLLVGRAHCESLGDRQ